MRARGRATGRAGSTGRLIALLLAALVVLPALPRAARAADAPLTGLASSRLATVSSPSVAAGTRTPADLLDLSVRLVLPDGPLEPDRDFVVGSSVTGGDGPLSYRWNDSLGVDGDGASLTLVAPSAGAIGVGLLVTDAVGVHATANASIGIGSAPSLAVASTLAATDVGLPIPVAVTVDGSYPPFALQWQALPTGPSGSETLGAASTLVLSVTGSVPGAEWLRVAVDDHGGGSASVEAVVARLEPDLTLLLSADPAAIDAGTEARVSGLLLGGTAPFAWTAAADLPCANVTGATGEVGATLPITWGGRFLVAGNATLRVDVTDAGGLLVVGSLSILVLPALAATLEIPTTSPAAGRPLNLSAELTGGRPPYDYLYMLSDGESASGLLPSEGPADFVAAPNRSGFLEVDLRVTDAIGGLRELSTSVLVGPALPGSPTDPVAGPTGVPAPGGAHATSPALPPDGAAVAVGASVAVVALVAVVTLLLVRRRWPRRSDGPPDTDELAERETDRRIREALVEADGVERTVLEVLLGADGIEPPAIDRSIARLRALGELRVEPGGEGGSTLYRTPPTEPTAREASEAP